MLNYACCKYVVTKATVYHSSLIDLSRSRSVHAVEHQPCCPDPQLLSAADCKAVHYGLCSPLLKLPSFSVAPTSPTKTAPQPPRAQSASPAAALDLEALDPVELLAADLEGKLEALVNSFVAQDKVRLAARKSKTTAVPSAQASSSGKRAVLSQPSSVDSSSKASSSFSSKNKTDVDSKLEAKKKWLGTSDKEVKAKKDNSLKSGETHATKKDASGSLLSSTSRIAKKEVTPARSPKASEDKATSLSTLSRQATPDVKSPKSGSSYNASRAETSKVQVAAKPAVKELKPAPDEKARSPVLEPVINADKSQRSPSPTSTRSSPQRTVFKVSPPSVISLVTGTPKPTTTQSFSATYVPTVTTAHAVPALITTDSVKVEEPIVAKSPKEPVRPSCVSVPKEPISNASSQSSASDTKPATSALSQALDPKLSTAKQSTSPTVDYAKARFQGNAEPQRFEELQKQGPKNGHVVNDAKSRWESLTSPEQLWTGGGPTVPCTIPTEPNHEMDSPLSTSPRRLHSPDGLYMEGGAPAIPHPKLTSSQKQHIRERSLSPTERTHAHVPVRPFLTKGSVAERVLLFERCPERNLERTPAPARNKTTVYNTWKHGSVDSQTATQSPHEKAFVESQTASLKRVVRSSAKATCIPRFYYPQGKPLTAAQVDAHLKKVCAAFAACRDGRATRSNFAAIARACGIPLYWKMPLFVACGGESRGYVTSDIFTGFWKRVVSGGRDEPTWFVKILSKGTRNYLLPDDFIPMMQDVIDTHPGLTFLKEAVEFHSRYVNTVSLLFSVTVRSSVSLKRLSVRLPFSGKAGVVGVRRDSVGHVTRHAGHVTHDVRLDASPTRSLTSVRWAPCLSGYLRVSFVRGPIQREGKMSYSEFVWFIMSEEDKRHPRSIEYWFRCMDIDGDGYLSMYELDYFYEEQLTRMEALGIETLPFGDCLCQMLDMIQPQKKDKVSLADLKRCKMTPIFFDTFFNLEKYLDHEQRDPFASQRDHDGDGLEISDWDRFAAEEYELLVAEEGNLENHDLMYGDYDPDDDDLSPHLDKLSEPFRCRGRGGNLDDDEYDYAETDADYHY
ncbi:unnamed protein product [Ixodes hexagonus]